MLPGALIDASAESQAADYKGKLECLETQAFQTSSNRSSGLASTAWVLHHRVAQANQKIQSTTLEQCNGGIEPMRLSPHCMHPTTDQPHGC